MQGCERVLLGRVHVTSDECAIDFVNFKVKEQAAGGSMSGGGGGTRDNSKMDLSGSAMISVILHYTTAILYCYCCYE